MDDARLALREKLLKDIAIIEDRISLMRSGKIETFSIEAGGKRIQTTEGSIAHDERTIENLKAVLAKY